MRASHRQRNVYTGRRAENNLVLTHGDAKWDNWFNASRVLGDFGSTKISTEYKDIAKSLLDSAHITEHGLVIRRQDKRKTETLPPEIVIDDYVDLYIMMRGMLDNPIQESPEQFKLNVYDAIVTESVRTIFYKQESNPLLAERLGEIAETYVEVGRRYRE